MLSKISKIKGSGLVFRDFHWSPNTPSFKAVNLLYGWNGCGKTTLSRLFDEFSTPTDPAIEYELELSDGQTIQTGAALPIPVRVFNEEYINKNVRLVDSTASSISVLLGEENTDLLTQITSDEKRLYGTAGDKLNRGLLAEFEADTQKRKRKENENDKAFTDIARTIGAAVIGSGSTARNYRAPDAKRELAHLTEATILPAEELASALLTIRQEPLEKIADIAPPLVDVAGRLHAPLTIASEYLEQTRRLCRSTAESEVISALEKNTELSKWVEHGLTFHTTADWATCQFCGGPLSQERMQSLVRHFSEADRRLKREIDELIARLRAVPAAIQNTSVPDPARLYKEFQQAYENALLSFRVAQGKVALEIQTLEQRLQDKKSKTTEPVEFDGRLELEELRTALGELNRIISAHNAQSDNFASIHAAAQDKVKAHYLSTIRSEVVERTMTIEALDNALAARKQEIEELKRRIAVARSKISSEHKGCDQINDAIRTFLGRSELRFESDLIEDPVTHESTVRGYRILRGDKLATKLSEGEKTAIAFAYFVVHLSDGQFSKSDGIVVIDDPISSLDSNSLYQAFSFLKNAVLDCRQVFILTHNFDFLKLLLNWRKHVSGGGTTGFYMIKNQVRDDVRHASIDPMDRELRVYESEYQYLFKCLKEMQANQNGTILRAYPVPNIARKLWETFLMFQVPNGRSLYDKMERLKQRGNFDSQKLDAIYKFTNAQSHMTGSGFDPALVPETQKVIAEIFEMMNAIAPDHYDALNEVSP